MTKLNLKLKEGLKIQNRNRGRAHSVNMAEQLLGKSVKMWLKSGESFYFKVTGYQDSLNGVQLMGYDSEGMNWEIDFDTMKAVGIDMERGEVI